jgi:hypothetical protein
MSSTARAWKCLKQVVSGCQQETDKNTDNCVDLVNGSGRGIELRPAVRLPIQEYKIRNLRRVFDITITRLNFLLVSRLAKFFGSAILHRSVYPTLSLSRSSLLMTMRVISCVLALTLLNIAEIQAQGYLDGLMGRATESAKRKAQDRVNQNIDQTIDSR